MKSAFLLNSATESMNVLGHIGSIVERTDNLYTSMKQAPSLRVVVQETDTDAMLTHGYYVAHLRNRF